MNAAQPAVSVVMSVYDRPDLIAQTIDSVLHQEGVELEFVIVDDGADAAAKSILAAYQSDPRVRILEQQNQGLTRALITACRAATAPLIARIDVGDVMQQGRLSKQASALMQDDSLGLVSSWVEVVTDDGHFLYHIKHTAGELNESICARQPEDLVTPVHAAVMFRASAYLAVGGYRDAFYFAQDCDLWARMSQCSKVGVISETLTTIVFSASGISGRYRDQQLALRDLIAQGNVLRAADKPDDALLARAQSIRPTPLTESVSSFAANYFIARCLDRNGSQHALAYWQRAWRSRPWSVKAIFFLTRSMLMRGRQSSN